MLTLLTASAICAFVQFLEKLTSSSAAHLAAHKATVEEVVMFAAELLPFWCYG